tara:strand:- start:471 stop:626 length:156 start_codon:yes stop_codon:yes gene_type:complete
MEPEKKFKCLWVDPEIHEQVLALADFQRRTIRSVVEHILRKAIQEEAEKSG